MKSLAASLCMWRLNYGVIYENVENKLINSKSGHIVLFPNLSKKKKKTQCIAKSVRIWCVTMLLDTESSKSRPTTINSKKSVGRNELCYLAPVCADDLILPPHSCDKRNYRTSRGVTKSESVWLAVPWESSLYTRYLVRPGGRRRVSHSLTRRHAQDKVGSTPLLHPG